MGSEAPNTPNRSLPVPHLFADTGEADHSAGARTRQHYVDYAPVMTAQIVRPIHGRLELYGLRAPRAGEPSNRMMFQDATGRAIRPTWIPAELGRPGWTGHWTIAREHLTVVAEVIALRDGAIDIEMHYSEAERCDWRCQNAKGSDCVCSCEGEHHGTGEHAAWKQVGDTTLVRSTGIRIVHRRLTAREVRNGRR